MHALLYDRDAGTLREGGRELVEAWQEAPASVLWLDAEGLDAATAQGELVERFGFHPLAVQDAMRDRHPPKFEAFADHLFVSLRGLDADARDVDFDTLDIALFVGERLLVSRRTGHSINTAALWQEARAEPSLLARPVLLATMLMRRVLRRYVEIALALEPRLAEIEDEILARDNDDLLAELTRYKARLRNMRRICEYHEHMVEGMEEARREEHPVLAGDETAHRLVDIHDQVRRARSLAELHFAIASDLIDGYLALASHRLNQVMQLLTVFTVIFVPLSFLAGIYGMNFENMPELKSSFGYYVLLGVMAAIATALLVYFRRRGWLWNR